MVNTETEETLAKVNDKKALKAGVWYVIASVLLKAAVFITTPIFTRVLTKAEFGTVSNFNSWHILLVPIFTLSLDYSIGRAKLDYTNRFDDYVGSIQLLSTISSLFISIIVILFIDPISGFIGLERYETILLLLYQIAFTTVVFAQNVYRYTYNYKKNILISSYSIIANIILSLILIYVFSNSKALMRMIGIATPIIALSIVYWVNYIKNKTIKINKEYWKYGFVISAPMIFHHLSMHILSQSDRVVIRGLCGEEDLALYTLVYSFGTIVSILTTAIAQGWLPWFHDTYHAKRFSEIRNNVKPFVLFGCYVALACVAFAPEGILLFGGKKYIEAVPCVMPVVLGVLCQFIYTHYVNIELHLKKTKYVSVGTAIAAIFNVITNLYFIPRYGYIAAAYTTLASYFVLLAIHMIITKVVLKVNLYDDLFMIASYFIVCLISVGLTFIYSNTFIRYCIIVIGFTSFIFMFKQYFTLFKKFSHSRKG